MLEKDEKELNLNKTKSLLDDIFLSLILLSLILLILMMLSLMLLSLILLSLFAMYLTLVNHGSPWFTCVYNVHSMSIQFLFNLFPMSIQCLLSVHSMCIRYILYSVSIVRLMILIPLLSFPKFRDANACKKGSKPLS